MASLNEIAQLCYDIIFPLPRGKNSIDIEDFKATSKVQYAAAMWIYRQELLNTDGQFQMPSDLLSESDPLPVVDDSVDVSGLNYLSALPNDLWLQNIGGLGCDCKYVKSTLNLSQVLCGDDSLGNEKPYYIIGKKIKFPEGADAKTLVITYANMGNSIDDDVEVNEYIGAKVQEKLLAIYGKKLPADETNNNAVDS